MSQRREYTKGKQPPEQLLSQTGYGSAYYPYHYEDEIDLREYISILWKWKTLIISITLASMLIAGVISFFVLKPVYEASTQIIVSKDSIPHEVIKSDYFLAEVIGQLNLSDEERYTPGQLGSALSISGKSGELTTIKVQDKDPVRASKIANTVADLYGEFVQNKSLESIATNLEILDDRRNTTQIALDDARKELNQLRQSSKINIMKSEVSWLASEINQWKANFTISDVKQTELSKGIEELKRLLASTPKAVPGPPDWAGNVTQIPNQTYQQLEIDLISKQIELQELEIRLDKTQAKIPLLEEQYSLVYEEYLEADRQIRELESTMSSLNLELHTLDNAIIDAQSSIAEVIIAAPAIAPKSPIKPRKMLNVAVSAVLGGFLSVLAVFFIEYWRSSAEADQSVKA